MNRSQMTELAHHSMHQLCPREWRSTPLVSGDYDLDQTMLHRHNKDLPHRLELYLRRGGQHYGSKTAYSGYSNYHGDN